jgi:serpin B
LRDDFLDTLGIEYGTGVREVDFRSDPDTARAAINNWARGASRDSVTELVARGVVTDQTRLLDTSAASLRAPWRVPFRSEDTTSAPFTFADGRTGQVRMMQSGPDLTGRTGSSDGWTAVEIPYIGDQLTMTVVVPDAGRFDEIERDMSLERIAAIDRSLEPARLDLQLPRFQFQSDLRLDESLRVLGLIDAFDENTADFAAMTVTGDDPLHLSASVHQSYLDATESGTGSQGGSIVVSGDDRPTNGDRESIRVDRPFIVLVRERESGLVLLMGRVVDPTG